MRLGDAISDLPEVTNNNGKDEMEYAGAPQTSFQKYIRLRKQALGKDSSKRNMLYDHRPLELNEDDCARVCHIPKIKVLSPNLYFLICPWNYTIYFLIIIA
ncbi:putative DNA (cytosine-5-)-methyltransferase [Helianthus annuus]|nr:putative DNA (cytosine-5-)-methyltransferase [Helianthus annuus]